VIVDSGNGGYLLARIELENTNENSDLVNKCLQTLDFLYSDETFHVDTTSGNPARILRVPGTLNAKGDEVEDFDMHHRMAKVLEAPDSFEVVPREKLEALITMLPEEVNQSKIYSNLQGQGQGFDPIDYCKKHNLAVHHTKPFKGGIAAVLETCIFNPDHHLSACIIGWPNGVRAYRCRHNSCLSKHWKDARAIIEPDYKEKEKQKQTKRSVATILTEVALEHSELWKSSGGLLYATIAMDSHSENHPLDSNNFKQWLSKLFYDEFKETPTDNVLKDTVRLLSGHAQNNGKIHDTFSRVGHAGCDTIYVDLGHETWNSIEITKVGWQIINQVPIKFVRSTEMQPLPMPERGGAWADLDLILGHLDRKSKILIIGWLMQAFWPQHCSHFLNSVKVIVPLETTLGRYVIVTPWWPRQLYHQS
jgi:hypothetical protein